MCLSFSQTAAVAVVIFLMFYLIKKNIAISFLTQLLSV